MNCAPGDLARVIDCPATRMHGVVDKIIRVTVADFEFGEAHWHYEPPFLQCQCGCGSILVRAVDSVLRPIRHPGDGAVDEVLQRVGLPEAETA